MKFWEIDQRPDTLFLRCSVGCDEFLLFEVFMWEGRAIEDSVGLSVVDAYRPETLWRRIKSAWKLITTGYFERSSVELTLSDLDKIISWCQNVKASFKEVEE